MRACMYSLMALTAERHGSLRRARFYLKEWNDLKSRVVAPGGYPEARVRSVSCRTPSGF
jgi:hypothetical protein